MKHSAPSNFQQFLISSLDSWLGQQQVEAHPTSSNQTKALCESQGDIGWTNFTRGFISQKWSDFLHSETCMNQPMKGTTNSFLCKLIHILWNAQTTFWTSYQERRHALPDSPEHEADKLIEIKETVTYLYSLRNQVNPAHHSTYFPDNLQSFLKHSTHAQLQSYTKNYGPAIKTSIKQYKDHAVANTRNIFTFPGFQRTTITQNATPTTSVIETQGNETLQTITNETPTETTIIPLLPTTQIIVPNRALTPIANEEPLPEQTPTPGTIHHDAIPTEPPPIPPPPNIPPPAPD